MNTADTQNTNKKASAPETHYDYNLQCWIEAGRVAKCGHKSPQTGCYACAHVGESVTETPSDTLGKWHYEGDKNIEYGGAFFDLTDWDYGYVNAVCVTDLDSGCGFTGAVLIEKITILLGEDEDRAASSCGFTLADIDTNTDGGKLQLASALMSYGRFDPANEYYEPANEVVQTQDEGPMEFDGWKATKRVLSENLDGYVRTKLD